MKLSPQTILFAQGQLCDPGWSSQNPALGSHIQMLPEANPLPLGSSRLVCIPGVGSALLTWETVEPTFRRELTQANEVSFFSGFHNFNVSVILSWHVYV